MGRPMRKFKVGDSVKVIEAEVLKDRIGQAGVVEYISDSNDCRIRFKDEVTHWFQSYKLKSAYKWEDM